MENIYEMSRKDFEKLKFRESFDNDIREFDSLIILPAVPKKLESIKYAMKLKFSKIFKLEAPREYEAMSHLHDSGFLLMDFIATRGDEPICRLSGCSDVIHFDGIGGYGKNWVEIYGKCPDMTPPAKWKIDCLPKSGLLRIFGGKITAGAALSSFCIYSSKRIK